MSALENKQLLAQIFSELAKGNSQPFIDHMADEFSWTISGTTKWSKTYPGKSAVLTELFGALRSELRPPITVIANRFFADEDCVVVEARGKNTTRDGTPYNNTYCYVFELAEGKLLRVTEYLDTDLVNTALGDPSF